MGYFEVAPGHEVQSVTVCSSQRQGLVFGQLDPLQKRSQIVQARTVGGSPTAATAAANRYRVPVAVIPSGKISFQAVMKRFISSSVPIDTRK